MYAYARRYEGVILLNRGHGELDIQYRDEIGSIHISPHKAYAQMLMLLAYLVCAVLEFFCSSFSFLACMVGYRGGGLC